MKEVWILTADTDYHSRRMWDASASFTANPAITAAYASMDVMKDKIDSLREMYGSDCEIRIQRYDVIG